MIVKFNNKLFDYYFEELAKKIDWFPSLYSIGIINLFEQRAIDNNKVFENCSFILLNAEKPIACFIGVKMGQKGKVSIRAYELPSIILIDEMNFSKNQSKLFILEIKKYIDDIAGIFYYRDTMLDGSLSILSKYLLSKGAKATPRFSIFIDLLDSEKKLKSNIRKSYKSLISWGEKELKSSIYDASNITWKLINDFRLLHNKESGTETMSVLSWKKRLDIVKRGEAFLIMGYYNSELVTAGFFTSSSSHCYYGSSASRRDLFDKPIFHAILWKAILHAKKIGCKWFEVGDQINFYITTENSPSIKEKNISKFKAGFGGKTKVLLDIEAKMKKLIK